MSHVPEPDDARGSARTSGRMALAATLAVAAALALRTTACSSVSATEESEREAQENVTVVATGLDVPWDLAFLPDGDLLVTERPGRLVRLSPDGTRRWSVAVDGVRQRGEGGLLGLALDPAFADNGRIYLYYTTADDNRIVRYRLGADGALTEATVLLDGIPAASFHDGGRIAFGPDGLLYASTGDAGREDRARDPDYLGGKILRMTAGGAPADNPFARHVYTLGHRNPEGLTWAPDGTMWSTEHGRSGLRSGLDELNRIVAGDDYGWPDVQGDGSAPDVHEPAAQSGPDHTWAPAGAAWADGRVWFTGLRGEALYEAVPSGDAATVTPHLQGTYGRLRGGRVGPDGMLWFFTSNTDGRGSPRDGDDRLLRVDPAALGGGAP